MNEIHFHPLREGFGAAKKNLVPGLALQVFALLIVLTYYFIPVTGPFFDTLGKWKITGGFLYSFVSTAFFGGLVPFLFLKINPSTRVSTPWKFLPFYIGLWGYRGVEIDFLYRLQSLMFGNGASWEVLLPKVLFDQFVYNVFWAAPFQLLAFHFMNSGCRVQAFASLNWREFFLRRIPTTWISTWGVWIPTVTIIYSLPASLQIPLFNVVLCFWVLLITTLTRPRVTIFQPNSLPRVKITD